MTPKKEYLKRYTSIPIALDMLRNRRLGLVSPNTWEDKNDKFLVDRFCKIKNWNSVSAVCMTEASETFHHWRVFADTASGICVEFKKEPLVQKLLSSGGVLAEKVDYYTIDRVSKLTELPVEKLPFIKRYGYKDEREFRILKENENSEILLYVDIDLDCINRVILSPFIFDSLTPPLKDLINLIQGCEKVKITKSRLTDSESWKKIWNKVGQAKL